MSDRQSALAIRSRAETSAAKLPPLMVAAERIAATVAHGIHGRRRVGQGDSFWQFRRFDTGDSVQQIDWRQSAKTEAIFVREMEWEAAQSVWLWRDASGSMRYRSARDLPEKAERADILTLALGSLLVRGGERVALLGETSPGIGRSALERIALALSRQPAEEDALGLPAFAPLPRYGQLILVGDFLSPLDEIETIFRQFAAQGLKGYVLQVLDPAEEELPFAGRARFEGLEDEGRVLVRRIETVREDYNGRLTDQIEGVRNICRRIGWRFDSHRTDRSPETALLSAYVALSAALMR